MMIPMARFSLIWHSNQPGVFGTLLYLLGIGAADREQRCSDLVPKKTIKSA
jgi:hypothetical protein